MNLIQAPQQEKLGLDCGAVQTLNRLLGDQFTSQFGRKWVKITKPDKTSEVQLDAPISNAKWIQWLNQRFEGVIEKYSFEPLSEGKYRLVIPEPIKMNAKAAIDKTIAGGFSTGFCRFSQMYLRMLETPLHERTNANVLVVGPGMLTPKDFGEINPLLRDAVLFPQLSELFHLYSRVTAMDKSGPVLDALRVEQSVETSFPGQLARQTLLTQVFSRQTEKYLALAQLFCSPPRLSSKLALIEGDIAHKRLESRFDIIVATRVLLFIPTQNNVETKEEGQEIAVNTLCHLLSGLTVNGKLYIDQFSIDVLVEASQMTLDLLLEEVRTKLSLSSISKQIIPHDATLERDGHPCIESTVTSHGHYWPIPTDNLYEFTANV